MRFGGDQPVPADDGARLGLATTRELLAELETRGAIGRLDEALSRHAQSLRQLEVSARQLRVDLPAAVLDYRPGAE